MSEVIPHQNLLARAQVSDSYTEHHEPADISAGVRRGVGEVGQKEGNTRRRLCTGEWIYCSQNSRLSSTSQEYKAVNAKESKDLAQAFVSEKFLRLDFFLSLYC